MRERVDHMIIGGGIYGMHVATSIAEAYPYDDVMLLEQEEDLGVRASTHNHGRLHMGYQYPLIPETAIESRENVAKFRDDFNDCVDEEAVSFYGIHRVSRISARGYEEFCRSTGLGYDRISSREKNALFGPDVISAYQTDEVTFSSQSLVERMKTRVKGSGVVVRTGLAADRVSRHSRGIEVVTSEQRIVYAKHVFNCAYSGINDVNRGSGLAEIPSMHERYALFKVKLPEEVKGTSATVIYGPYASIVSQESGEHVLAHVTHSNLSRSLNVAPTDVTSDEEIYQRYELTRTAATPYLATINDAEYRGAIVEVKSVFGDKPAEGERRVQKFINQGGVSYYDVIFSGKMNAFYDAGSFAVDRIRERRAGFQKIA